MVWMGNNLVISDSWDRVDENKNKDFGGGSWDFLPFFSFLTADLIEGERKMRVFAIVSERLTRCIMWIKFTSVFDR